MDKSLEHLMGLQGVFAESHPQYAEFLGLIAQAQRTVQVQLAEFHRLAWGRVPGNWYSDS